MPYAHQFAKMLALAAVPALIAFQWCSWLTALTIGAALLYLLLVRAG